MYGGHQDGGMTKIESRDINFIETDFPSISDVKGDLDLYELEDIIDDVLSLSKGGEITHILYPVITENGTSLQSSGSTLLDASRSVPKSVSTPQGIQDSQLAH